MSSPRRASNLERKLASLVETISDWAVRIGLFVIVAVFIYVMLGVFTRQLFEVRGADLQRAVANVSNFTEYMMVCTLVVCLVLVFKKTEDTQELYSIIFVGALFLWFGFPFVVNWMGGMAPENQALRIAGENFARTGQIALGTLAWPILRMIVRNIKLRPIKKQTDDYQQGSGLRREPPKGAKPRLKPNLLSPCWHLPYCRDYLVERCPAFLARKRCWKFGGGCFCDNRMIEIMLTGMPQQKKGGQSYLRAEIAARTGVAQQRKTKPPCKRCFIYLEHQNLKYEVMHLVAYPLTAAVMYFGYQPIVRRGWMYLHEFLQGIWQRIAFHAAQPNQSMEQAFGLETVTIMFATLIGMSLLLGLLRFCEKWCFEWKL